MLYTSLKLNVQAVLCQLIHQKLYVVIADFRLLAYDRFLILNDSIS